MDFFVPGVPKPGGSKRAIYNAKLGRSLVIEDCKGNKDWRAVVALAAQQARGNEPLMSGAIDLRVEFVLPRPKHHFRANGQLKPTAPFWHTSKPDATKLLRALEDALTKIAWNDDAQVAYQEVRKRYGTDPGACVVIKHIRLDK